MPRKTLAEQRKSQGVVNVDTDVNVNRIRAISDGLVGNEDPDDLMYELISALEEGSKQPQVGKYYIFVYNPKTPNIKYDQNPLVAVTETFSWGFRGINYHWRKSRQYTWNEIPGGLYEVYSSELKDLQQIPFANYRLNI